MKTKAFLQIWSKWLPSSTGGRLVLLLLLIGHLCCALLIWFVHSPGLQSWAALPIINGFVTFWLLAKPQTQCRRMFTNKSQTR
jgi:antibiotic biosynthesis monooxygenase (ABM) superfamily enzyme